MLKRFEEKIIICIWFWLSARASEIQSSFLENIPSPSIGNVQFEILNPFVTEDGQRCTIEDGCLTLETQDNNYSKDNLGSFNETIFQFKSGRGSKILFSVRRYVDGIKVYKQHFIDGLTGTSCGDKDDVSSAFPVFALPAPSLAPNLRFATPGGYMLGWTMFSQGSLQEDLNQFRDGEGGGIVVLSQEHETGTNSVVMAGLREPMSINVRLDRVNRRLLWGIQGLAKDIPAGYTIEVITREDIHSTVQNVLKWGKAELNYHQNQKIADPTAKYLSYWTDNGAAYYYNIGPYESYTDLILDIYDNAQRNSIPIRSVQLDSWWYHKGIGGGVKNWTELPSAIPAGIREIKDATGYLITAHNRYFGSDTDYAIENGGQYPFVIDEKSRKSLPLDINFWNDLMQEAKSWGLQTYEQDWLNIQYEDTSALHSNVTLASSWLDNMGEAALKANINIQYCMALPRQFIHSAKLAAVTQIRVSDDYLLNPDQWQIGKTSLFAHSLGLFPFKDLFWTSKVNEGVIYNDCESLLQPDPNDPIAFLHTYKGYRNTTVKGIPCLEWSSFGFDSIFPNGDLRKNFCRNPSNLKNGAYCYTDASPDISTTRWKWDYCKPPICHYDCYTSVGGTYIGNANKTHSGKACHDWQGKFGLTGAYCRNLANDSQPWCYTDLGHTMKENCSVAKCPEHTEFNPDLQSAIGTLSAGPVGVGDKIENLKRNLILKSCNDNGLILKPSTPLMVTDLFFTKNIDKLWTAHSTILYQHYGIIFTAENEDEYIVSPLDLNLEVPLSTRFVFYDNYPTSQKLFKIYESNSTLVLPPCKGYMQFCLYYTSPIIRIGEVDIAVLGELSKWTTVSPQRIVGFEIQDVDFQLFLLGSSGEVITMTFYSSSEGVFAVNCNFKNKSVLRLSVLNKKCF